ncbi:putative mediator of RNA polymerase II transcription subunit 19 [Zerene cesonia]|uniref:putative mediator of RNA polymerase II transcription subunit 19 n=1 Tax=Zerene cesonia TaxID=33412 RepID=UPI0018E544AD|nr:putative mediator of RNA polymerase II transcription subunit 19 [Zerene cesonia]
MSRFLVFACVLMLVSAALTEESSENPNNMNHSNMNHMNSNNPNSPNMNHMIPNIPNSPNMNPNNINPNIKPGEPPKLHNHNTTKMQELPKLPEKAENPTTTGKN